MAKITRPSSRFARLLLLVLLVVAVIGFATFLPSRQPFEGSLSLQNLSFVSTVEQPFLLNTSALSEFSLKGDLPLRLTGTFIGNPDLQQFNILELEPLNEDATWQITAPRSVNLSLTELNLTPQTEIRHLSYDEKNHRLVFDIRPSSPISLNLQPTDSVRIQLNNYRIKNAPRLQAKSNFDFTWQPNNEQFLTLRKPTHLEIQFADLTSSPFQDRIDCEKVILDKPQVRSTDYKDHYRESAILGGTIRLTDKSYTLDENQFLTFQPFDSIRTLLRLRLAAEKTTVKLNDNQLLKLNQQQPGLQVDVSGTTERIMIGLNEQLPVAKLQASLLEAWMPHDAVIALLTCLSTLVITSIGWLWEIATDKPKSK